MIVIWNGLGCLVIPVVAIGVMLALAIKDFAPNQRWLQLVAVAFTSSALFGLGWLLNRRPAGFGRDEWGHPVQIKQDHSLYWVPVQYWSGIVAVAGVLWILSGR
jgi:hypothetical protein